MNPIKDRVLSFSMDIITCLVYFDKVKIYCKEGSITINGEFIIIDSEGKFGETVKKHIELRPDNFLDVVSSNSIVNYAMIKGIDLIPV